MGRIRAAGFRGVLRAVRARVPRARAKTYALWRDRLVEARGLEIGGPTSEFRSRGSIPIYPIVAGLDNCTFSATTLWSDEAATDHPFVFDRARPAGRQLITEAVEMAEVADGQYDFVLASHVLEHIANPLKALREWIRVVRPGGTLVLLVPQHVRTFDHRRSVTPLEHLINDFESDTQEADLTHLPEILDLHDLRRDPAAGSRQAFEARSRKNLVNRALHHHVFDEGSLAASLTHLNCRMLATEAIPPHHLLAVAETPAA